MKLPSFIKSENLTYVIKNRFVLGAISLLFFNGINNKTFELIRLSIHQKLVLRYRKVVRKSGDELQTITPENFQKLTHKTVWLCWLQGIDDAPDMVKRCYDSVNEIEGMKVIVIDSSNFMDHVDFPSYIIEKWNSGIITHTHFSDLLRLELLYTHGGVWLDSTVYCSSTKLPQYLANSWLFMFQVLKPGLNGHSLRCSSWAMSAVPQNPVLELCRTVLYDYWNNAKKLEDYFLFHIVLSSVLEEFPIYCNEITKACNSTPHLLQLEFNNKYDEFRYSMIFEQTKLHKLTYKFDLSHFKSDTFLVHFLEDKK